jgi:hypothetical protein
VKNKLIVALVLVLSAQIVKPNLALAFDTSVSAGAQNGQVQADTVPVDINADPQPATVPPTIQDILTQVCETRGYGEDCAKQLLGMIWKESRGLATAVGDHGQAQGYFQIHYKLHHISLSCAQDLKCSANWTLDYLESNFYPKYVKYAIQCHNGCNADNGYVDTVLYQGKRLWNTPLPVNPVTTVALK